MAKYTKMIQEYCEQKGVHVPLGFKRHPASHIAVIRYDAEKPTLVAKTFFKKEDLNYYISSSLMQLALDGNGNLPAKVIDFKENKQYLLAGNGSLVPL